MSYITIDQFCEDYDFTPAEARLLVDCHAIESVWFGSDRLIDEHSVDEVFQYRIESGEKRLQAEKRYGEPRFGA